LERLHGQRDAIHERMLDQGIYSDEEKSQLSELLQAQRDVDNRIDTVEGEWVQLAEDLEQLR